MATVPLPVIRSARAPVDHAMEELSGPALRHSGPMNVVHIIPDLTVHDIAAADDVQGSYLGLDRQELGLDWVTRHVASSGATLQLVTRDGAAQEAPVMSIAVDDLNGVYEEARRRGYEIVHPLTTEPWGVQRFFVRTPAGNVLNILRHRE